MVLGVPVVESQFASSKVLLKTGDNLGKHPTKERRRFLKMNQDAEG